MKVYLNPTPEIAGIGGIRSVLEGMLRYLPDYGVEFVDSPTQADLVNCHATSIVDHPNLVLSCHGLYWKNDIEAWQGASWVDNANSILVSSMRKAKSVTVPSQWVANAVSRGMLIKPYVCNHGVTLDEWEVRPSQNYVLWNKNRHDPSCDSRIVNTLAGLVPDTHFVTTFGRDDMNVSVIGKVDHPTMKEYIQNAGVYLATAKETFGVGILEAMASGVPVLGWNWGGQQEIVTHLENGYLAKPGDYNDLVNGLMYCMEYRNRLGEYGREVVTEKYQWKDVIKSYLPAYEKALETYPVKVSVIVTAYNLADYLPDCVISVLKQTYKDFELIIVDDCSTDNTGVVADELALLDPRVRVIHNPKNVHVSESRNIGIRASHGEYILPLDADDTLHENALSAMVRSLETNSDYQIATGAMEVFTEGSDKSFVSGWPPSEPSYENQIHKQNQLPYSSMYRRIVWESTAGYRRRIHTGVEDADFWTRAFSYGFKAKHVGQTTLLYLMRQNSLSHEKKGENWLEWHVHAKNATLTPFGALGGKNIPSYNPTLVSVIIPVGPGHEIYLQDCLDSLLNQTLTAWECIVVNDTGQRWLDDDGNVINPYLIGFPFIKIIDSYREPGGPGYARNAGLRVANAERIVFLDADDYAQPIFLEALYKTHLETGGYCYSDWYADNGKEIYPDKAKDFRKDVLLNGAVGPISGIFYKDDLMLVGGFDEEIAGWEDWDLHLSLLEKCICGTRIMEPLFTYRYRTGENRDKDFGNKDVLIQYITSKHSKLYGEGNMGCSACGGSKTFTPKTITSSTPAIQGEDIVLVKYIGNQTQTRSVKSQHMRGHVYRFGKDDVFQVYAKEAGRFVDQFPKDFVLVKKEPVAQPAVYDPVVVSTTVEKASYKSIKELDIDPEIIGLLEKAGYMTCTQASLASDASILRIKGMGTARLNKVREALKKNGY